MVELWIPYGKTEVVARIQAENLLKVVKTTGSPGVKDSNAEIMRALDNPLESKRLEDIVGSGDKVAIVVDDATRATPNRSMLHPILDKLNLSGVNDKDVSIIIGRGSHRPTKPNEFSALIGEDVKDKVKVVDHDCDANNLVEVGETSRGTKVLLNRTFMEADVKILTGDVGFHYYAGYSGGRKSILPAISGRNTIQHNHAFLLHPQSKTGNLDGNPVHLDMQEAAHMANVDFTLNLVLNSEKKIVKAFAGEMDKVFMQGVKLVDKMYKIPVEKPADIVLTSPGGYPLDIDLYQSYKAVDSALGVVKEGGVIILVAECPEGHGNQVFYKWMKEYKNIENVERKLKRKFLLGAHKAYYLFKALKNVKIFLVSTMPSFYTENIFRLRAANSVNLALQSAIKITGKNSKVLVLPYGSSTLPVVKK